MKQQTFIICVLASLAFGCEISHPIDPEIVECKIAGGTWQNSKCICPPDIAASTNQTVCRDGKIYTCSNGLLNLVTQCPGECSDNGKLCNLETGGDGDVCYSDKDEQTSLGYLYSCEDGKCELKTICPLGCNDEVGHENECKKCEDKSVMCQDEYLKTCINGYWDSGVKCLNGCDKEQKICSSKEGYSSEKTNCDGDYLETYYVYQNDQLELKERKYCYNGCSVNNGVAECISCEPNKLACDGNVLKICNENNVWVDKETCLWECSHGVCTCETNQTKCENNTLYICNDGYQTQISCPWGCGSDNKCNCDEEDNKCNGNILSTCENGNVIETYCARGCDENSNSCKQASDNSEPSCQEGSKECADNELKECKDGQWKITNCEKGCDETGKSCKQASDNPEPSCQEGRKECTNNTLKICKNGQWVQIEDCGEKGCDENSNSCKQASDNPESFCQEDEDTKKCIDNELKECRKGQWVLIEDCGDERVCTMDIFGEPICVSNNVCKESNAQPTGDGRCYCANDDKIEVCLSSCNTPSGCESVGKCDNALCFPKKMTDNGGNETVEYDYYLCTNSEYQKANNMTYDYLYDKLEDDPDARCALNFDLLSHYVELMEKERCGNANIHAYLKLENISNPFEFSCTTDDGSKWDCALKHEIETMIEYNDILLNEESINVLLASFFFSIKEQYESKNSDEGLTQFISSMKTNKIDIRSGNTYYICDNHNTPVHLKLDSLNLSATCIDNDTPKFTVNQ